MNIGGRRARLRGAIVAAVIGTATNLVGPAGAACVFVKPHGAQRFGHVGWGFRVTGTDKWVYGAIENPSGKLYTPPGGDIGAWHAEGTYPRMMSDVADAQVEEVESDGAPPGKLRAGHRTGTAEAGYRPSSTSNSPASRIALTAVR
jgi:hypothetical protein